MAIQTQSISINKQNEQEQSKKEKVKSETPNSYVNKFIKEKESQRSFRKYQEDKKKSQMVIYEDNSTYVMDHKMSPFQNVSQEFNPLEQELFNAFRKPQLQKMIIDRNNQNRISKMLLDSGTPTPIVNSNTPNSQKQSPSNNMMSLAFHNSNFVKENSIDSKIYIQIENNNIQNQQITQNQISNDNLGIQGTKINIQYLNASIEKQKETLKRKPQTQSMKKRIGQIFKHKNNIEDRKGLFFESDKNIQTQLMPQNMCQSENSNDKNMNKNDQVFSQYSQQSAAGNTEMMVTPKDTKLRPNFDQSMNSLKKFRQKSSNNPVKSTLNQNIQNNQVIISLKQQVQKNDEVKLNNQSIIQNPSHEQFQIVKVSEFQINLPRNIIIDKSNVPQTVNINDRNQLLNSERTNSIMSKQFKLISQNNEYLSQNTSNRSRQQLLNKEQKIKKLIITTQSKSSSNKIVDSDQNVTFRFKQETKHQEKQCLKQQVIQSPFNESEQIIDLKESQLPAWKLNNKYTRRLKFLREQHDYKFLSQINKILQIQNQKDEGSKERKENIQNSAQKEQPQLIKQENEQIQKEESRTNILTDQSTQQIDENLPFNFEKLNQVKEQDIKQNKTNRKKKENVKFKINEEQTQIKNNRDTDMLIQQSSRVNEGSCDLISDEEVSVQNMKQNFGQVKKFQKQTTQENPKQSYALALKQNKNFKQNIQTKLKEKSLSSNGVNSGEFPSQIINSGTFRANNLEIQKVKDEILNEQQNIKSLQLSNLFRNQDSLNHNYGKNTPLSEKNDKQSNLSIKKFNISYNSDQKASLLASSQKKQEIYQRTKYQFWNQLSNNQDLKELISKDGIKQIKKKIKYNQQKSMSPDEQLKSQIYIRRRSKNQMQDSFALQQNDETDNNIAQTNSDYFLKINQKKHLKNWYFVSSLLKKQKILENNQQSNEQVLSERNKQQVYSPQITVRNLRSNISQEIQNQKIISQLSLDQKQSVKAWPQNNQIKKDIGKFSQFQYQIKRNENEKFDLNKKQFFSHRNRPNAQITDKEMLQNYSNIALEGYLNNLNNQNQIIKKANQILQINLKSSDFEIINQINNYHCDEQNDDFSHLNIKNIELKSNQKAKNALQNNLDSLNSNQLQNSKFRNMFKPNKLKSKQINIIKNEQNAKENIKHENKLLKQFQEQTNESAKNPQLNSSSACNSQQSNTHRYSSQQIKKQIFEAKQFVLKKQTQQQYHPKYSNVLKTQRQQFKQFTSPQINTHSKYRFNNQDLEKEWINQRHDNLQLNNISYYPVKQINTQRNNQNLNEQMCNQSQYNNLKQLSFDQQQCLKENYTNKQMLTGQYEDAYTILRSNANKNKINQPVMIPTISISKIKNELNSQNNLNSTIEDYPINKIINQTRRKSGSESPNLSDIIKNQMLNNSEFENQFSLISRKILSVPQKDVQLKGASYSQEQDTFSESQNLTSQFISLKKQVDENQQKQIQDGQHSNHQKELVIFTLENSSRLQYLNQKNEQSRKKKKKKYAFKINNLSRPIFNINSPTSTDKLDFSIDQNNISFIPQNGYSDYHRYISKKNYKDRIQQIKLQKEYDPGQYQIYEKTLLDKKKEYLSLKLSQVYDCLIGRNQSEQGSEKTATGKTTQVDNIINQETDDQKERIICINNSFSPLILDRVQSDHLNNQMNETLKRNKFTNVHKSNDFHRNELITMTREFKNNDKHFTQRIQNKIEKSIQCDSTIKSLQNQVKNEQEEQEFILLQD